jgi:hypothetical protein
MTLMKSGHLADRLAAAGSEPVGRGEAGGLAGQHRGHLLAEKEGGKSPLRKGAAVAGSAAYFRHQTPGGVV